MPAADELAAVERNWRRENCEEKTIPITSVEALRTGELSGPQALARQTLAETRKQYSAAFAFHRQPLEL